MNYKLYIYVLLFIVLQPHIYFLITNKTKTLKITISDVLKSTILFLLSYIVITYIFKNYEYYNTNDESACTYVCSRGFIKRCDVKPTHIVSSTHDIYEYDWSELKPNSTVYIHGSAIPKFVEQAYPNISVPFILVSGDCDETISDDVFPSTEAFKQFIEDPRILHWYSQNAITAHPKLSIIPIGMAFHGIVLNGEHKFYGVNPVEYEQNMIEIANSAPKEKHMKCYGNFQFLMTTRYGGDRKEALEKIPKSCIDYEEKQIDTYDTWKNQVKYNFVVSPHGNGYDCHRTWEALALGIIPIVKTSPIDKVFEDLPVLIVKDWSEITHEFLKQSYDDITKNKRNGKYDMNKLTLDYWMNKIKSKAS
jgi:hypothetical protein